MCQSCEKMSRRTFTKNGITAASIALVGATPGPSFANSLSFTIPGEITPSYDRGDWVEAVNQADLETYRHSKIRSISYHHEGWADEKISVFNEIRAKKVGQTAVQRAHIIHNNHVGKRYGMIAYHYAVAPSGEIVKGRPLQYAPATGSPDPRTGEIANFDGHFAVLAMADFDFEMVADREQQVFAMIKIMSAAQRAFRVFSRDIRPHKDHVVFEGKFGTNCPGGNLYAVRKKIREMTLAVSFQSELAKRGCYIGKVDGLFGPVSQNALEKFSASNSQLGKLTLSDASLWSLMDSPSGECT